MIHRNRGNRRLLRHRAIYRKKSICNVHSTPVVVWDETKHHYVSDWSRKHPFDWYRHDGMYSKGKIHCSCPLCKFSRHYKLPTLRDIKENVIFKQALLDYYNI